MNALRRLWKSFLENYRSREERIAREGIFASFARPSGYVLIMVLIITPLLVSISVDFLVTANTSLGYVNKLKHQARAGALAKAGIELAKYVLMMDKKGLSLRGTGDKSVDSYNDDWAMDLTLPLSMVSSDLDGTLSIKISDENSKINLSVTGTEYAEKTPFYGILQRFFTNMGLPMDLADIIIDWVDPDDVPFPYGAESANYYQTLLPPYNAKNTAMNSIDELLLLKDFTPEVFYGLSENPTEADQKLNDDNRGEIPSLSELMMSKGAGGEFGDDEKNEFIIKKEKSRRLADYLTVYGKRDNHTDEYNKININTASYRVLSALTDNMTDDIVEEMISRRLQQPYKSTSEVKDLVKDEIILKLLSVESHFFTINSTVTIGNSRVSVRTVFNRSTRETHYWSEE